MSPQPESIFVSAPDGLRLHVRIDGAARDGTLPVVCLPGLSRNHTDFEALAAVLGRSRRVLSIDMRGRGLSEYDPDPANYTPLIEAADALAVLTALEAEPAIFVGTSRGGILTMIIAALRPGAIAGAVLNDIGPVIENKGVLRIKGYVGKTPQPRDYEEGAEILQRQLGKHFTRFTAEDWLAQARRNWWLKDGELVAPYDPALSRTLQENDLERPLPTLWAQFDALPDVPMMVIRGENSDLLSPETIAAMKARRKRLSVIEIKGEGHAPQLEGDVVIRIAALADECDGAH